MADGTVPEAPFVKRGGVVMESRDTFEEDNFFGRDITDAFGKKRRYIGLDTEGDASSDISDYPVQPLVCLQIYDPEEWDEPQVVNYWDAKELFEFVATKALMQDVTIVAHNAPYDFCCIGARFPELWPLIWKLLDNGCIEDTFVNEKLDAIARGHMDDKSSFDRWVTIAGKRENIYFSLADSIRYRCGEVVPKGEETWRVRYGELMEVPVEKWPAEALSYAQNDPCYVWALRHAQDEQDLVDPVSAEGYIFADAPAQARAWWGLYLSQWSGVRTNPLHVPAVAKQLEEKMVAVEGILQTPRVRVYQPAKGRKPGEWKTLPVLKPGKTRKIKGDWVQPSKCMRAIQTAVHEACDKLGIDVPMTDASGKFPDGQIKTDNQTLETASLAEGYEFLGDLKLYSQAAKLKQFLVSLALGYAMAIHTKPNVLVATGRTSWGSTDPDGIVDDAKRINLQNLPKYPGIRESYIPPPGYIMFAIDYKQLELCALATVCFTMFGYSNMLELINAGIDLHDALAAQFLGITYEEFQAGKENPATASDYDTLRQLAKAMNFGAPGGMGVKKFIFTTRKQLDREQLAKMHHLLNEEVVGRLKKAWFATFPEMKDYREVAAVLSKDGIMQQLTSGRFRSKLTFCACSNSFFQGLAADGAKEALYCIQRAMWAEVDSPCYGGHIFAFVHDEFVGCVPLASDVDAAVRECYKIAMQVMHKRLRHIDVRGSKYGMEGSMCLMRVWRKKADTALDSQGKLIPFEDGPKYAQMVAKGKIWDDSKDLDADAFATDSE